MFATCVANNSSPKKHSLSITGMSTLKKIFLAHCVTKHSERKSILLITSSANTQKILQDQFGIGCTLKIHIIGTHLLDAIKQTGETFHNESDEVVEQAHYRVNAFERIHGYLVSDRKMQTPNAAEKQQRMMEHLNSHHLR